MLTFAWTNTTDIFLKTPIHYTCSFLLARCGLWDLQMPHREKFNQQNRYITELQRSLIIAPYIHAGNGPNVLLKRYEITTCFYGTFSPSKSSLENVGSYWLILFSTIKVKFVSSDMWTGFKMFSFLLVFSWAPWTTVKARWTRTYL